jgi:hypothetical protein
MRVPAQVFDAVQAKVQHALRQARQPPEDADAPARQPTLETISAILEVAIDQSTKETSHD